jgi:hypothetical protein
MIPKLVRTRLKKIDVHSGSGLSLGGAGTMNVEVEASLSGTPGNDRHAIAEVRIAIEGVPKKAKDKTQYAFKAEAIVQGVYEWPEKVVSEKLKDRDLTNTLCQPLHVIAVTELITLVPRTGAGTITLPWTIDDGVEELPSRSSPKKATSGQTRKKTITA